MSLPASVLVVPCYNEQHRIDAGAFGRFAGSGRASLLFVDDGSTDGTHDVLMSIREAAPASVDVLRLDRNRGKAEAVRQGLRRALDNQAVIVGYADADLSTPTDELLRLLDTFDEEGISVVMGSRIARLGARIERDPLRHYLGRVFATTASLILSVHVYDTQCGAKWFRSTAALRAAVEEPFRSSWAFDVELLGRLLTGAPGALAVGIEEFREVPLNRWRDVRGSKLGIRGMVAAVSDLARIRHDFHARRKRAESRGIDARGA